MNLFKSLFLSAFSATVLFGAAPSFAVDANFSKSRNPGYVLLNNMSATARFATLTSDFPSGTSSRTKTIVSLPYSYTTYTNGFTSHTVSICMTMQYSTADEVCQDISGLQTGFATSFVGRVIAPGKDIYIKHVLSGGTYPTSTPINPDRITVNYRY